MPHQCTDCGRAFDDGSKEMLSGCPDCGGTTFQFRPEGVAETDLPEEEPPEPPEPVDSTVARKVGNAATTVRDLVSGSSSDSREESPTVSADDGPMATPDERPSRTPNPTSSTGTGPTPRRQTREDSAQASARSEIVSPDDLPSTSTGSETRRSEPVATPDNRQQSGSAQGEPARPIATHSGDEESTADQTRPDLSELRQELNDQFESIRVLEPGQYELNLMELYDREEYIVALQEDGKYTIQVPERWED